MTGSHMWRGALAQTLERLARERDEAVQFAARAHPQPEPELTMASTPNKSRQKAKVRSECPSPSRGARRAPIYFYMNSRVEV